ncbi:protein penguin [Coccinella septempunctata]|uniref:protein penguin n=1 Tax=Coccinella septempunctata TaxID=41139 RepID=UPI001D08576F|nr:protein penguin [Coccinella septempunctata]
MGVKRSFDDSEDSKPKKQKVVSKTKSTEQKKEHVEKKLKKHVTTKVVAKKTGKANIKKKGTEATEKTENKIPLKTAKGNTKQPDSTKEKKVNGSKGDNNKKAKIDEKPEDWGLFKKQKKELKLKRKQAKTNFDVVTQAKKLGEILRRKTLKDGEFERNKLVNELHGLLKKDGNYPKFVLAHDTARIVQWLLKYSSVLIRQEIAKELVGSIPAMMQSKYGVFCVKRLLKYGTSEIRAQIINSFYGHAVKLASHAISASYLEYAYTTWATPQQKYHLAQEFYGDMYKNSKDDKIKCLKDVFESSPSIKNAALSATKSNLSRILNKSLLDSGLVQTVLYQFLIECSEEDRSEMISQLSQHIVVISNSKDGSRAAMQCIWHGTNKDRKVIMKTLKEHLVELCKHEYGHCTIITILDAADDTVLLNKIIISEILKNAKDLSVNEWGRKVLLWLVVPEDPSYFHPQFIKELTAGRESSTSKKPVDIRRKEVLTHSSSTLLNLITTEPEVWLSDSKLAYEMLGIIKTACGKEVEHTFENLVKVITDIDWKIKENDKEIRGIEHPGLHLVLKKIAQHDKNNIEKDLPTFGASLSKSLTDEVIESWIQLNRGCFLLVSVFENNSEDTQEILKNKLLSFKEKLSKLNSTGAKILLKKLK